MDSNAKSGTHQRLVRQPIASRIRAAMAGRTTAPYYEIMYAVFPQDQYPRAWRYATGGGPPGCAMAFGNAVRRMGGTCAEGQGGERKIYVPNNKDYRP